MTNSSTPSEPNSPNSTDYDRVDRYRIGFTYPDRALQRYGRLVADVGWVTTTRKDSQIFTNMGESHTYREGLLKDLVGTGIVPFVELLTSFDPDWCVAPGAHIKERCSMLGITHEQLGAALGFSRLAFAELLTGRVPISSATSEKLSEVVGGTAGYWMALDRNYREGLLKGCTEDEH